VSYRRFFLIRLAQALFALWLVATLVFVMFFVLLEKPARNFAGGDQATPSQIQQVTEEHHLNAPLYEKYARYMWRLVAHQSAGKALGFQNPVDTEAGAPQSGAIARRAIPPTLSVVLLTLMVSIGTGGFLGFALARRRWRWAYGLPIVVAVSLLPVWVGLELAYYLGVRWEIVPIGNYCNFFASANHTCGGPVDWFTHLILPVVTLSVGLAAVYARMVRAELLRAGSDRGRRRGLLPFFARVAAFDFGALIGLSVFVEVVFQIPGLGRLMVVSSQAQSLVLMQSALLYAAFLGIAASFLVDSVAAAFDPGVRKEWSFVARPRRAA
jgi:ABC-type dipeptide/oligopeptide/nickel transport system permease component